MLAHFPEVRPGYDARWAKKRGELEAAYFDIEGRGRWAIPCARLCDVPLCTPAAHRRNLNCNEGAPLSEGPCPCQAPYLILFVFAVPSHMGLSKHTEPENRKKHCAVLVLRQQEGVWCSG